MRTIKTTYDPDFTAPFGFRYTSGRVVYEANTGHDDGVCALALAVAAKRRSRPLVFKVI